MHYIIFFISLFLSNTILEASSSTNPPSGYVTVSLMGQLGNQFFQIAAAYTYALDHNLLLTIPDLQNNHSNNISYNAKRLFLHKIATYSPASAPEKHWNEPSFNYTKIPSCSKISLYGYFQSEKYFKHKRNEILELLAPPSELQETILAKYPFLNSDALVVGIQIRDYRKEQPTGTYHPTKTRPYYEEAMSYFPKDTIFLVSSNNPGLAKECTEGLSSNIIYLKADYIEEFYTLVLCKSFIIGNSSFGWWASWLSTAENKVVIAPDQWFSPPYDNDMMKKDIFPEGCIILNH
ncbi:MAG: alpha-1,2-fucosyltransferase [Chlamydiota bacterium]